MENVFMMMNVLIVGDIMLDHYLVGDCNRISPEAPVPVVSINREEWRLGGAANVANNLVALRTSCTLIGVYGEDESAKQFDLLLQKTQLINNQIYKSNRRPTTVKSRVLVGGHQMIRLDRESTSRLKEEEEKAILERFYDNVEQADIILISDYSKGLLSKKILETIFKVSKTLNKITVVDPKSADFTRYRGANIIKPNRKEAEQATGIKITDNSSLELASKMIGNITESEAIITTLSEDGVGLFTDNNLHIIQTKAQKVFDVTGAGDTYLAAFAFDYLQSNNVFTACEFANLAAAVVVGKIGSSTATLEEINHIKAGVNAYEL